MSNVVSLSAIVRPWRADHACSAIFATALPRCRSRCGRCQAVSWGQGAGMNASTRAAVDARRSRRRRHHMAGAASGRRRPLHHEQFEPVRCDQGKARRPRSPVEAAAVAGPRIGIATVVVTGKIPTQANPCACCPRRADWSRSRGATGCSGGVPTSCAPRAARRPRNRAPRCGRRCTTPGRSTSFPNPRARVRPDRRDTTCTPR